MGRTSRSPTPSPAPAGHFAAHKADPIYVITICPLPPERKAKSEMCLMTQTAPGHCFCAGNSMAGAWSWMAGFRNSRRWGSWEVPAPPSQGRLSRAGINSAACSSQITNCYLWLLLGKKKQDSSRDANYTPLLHVELKGCQRQTLEELSLFIA